MQVTTEIVTDSPFDPSVPCRRDANEIDAEWCSTHNRTVWSCTDKLRDRIVELGNVDFPAESTT